MVGSILAVFQEKRSSVGCFIFELYSRFPRFMFFDFFVFVFLFHSHVGPIGRLRAATALKALPKDKSEVILSQFARLIVGSVLQKIKYRHRQKRFVYLSQKLDTINWSQLNKKDKPKGSLS